MKKSMIDTRRSKRNVSPEVQQYLQASLSQSTRRAYTTDIAQFLQWGGRIPAAPERLATYLAQQAEKLSYATLCRRVVAIGRAHTVKQLPSPSDSEIVKSTMQGIRRTKGVSQRRVAPVLLHDVRNMVRKLIGIRGARDKALLLMGFAGAFRRSELVAICVQDVQLVAEGMVIRLRRGKTDQGGAGRDIAVPYMRGSCCPVKAVVAWLAMSGITGGALFRRVDRYGHITGAGLTPQSVALIVKERAEAVGLDAQQLSGHSLRAGFVTSASQCGASSWKIRQQTGHRSEAGVHRYIRDSQLFTDNPLGNIR
jgi:integrase